MKSRTSKDEEPHNKGAKSKGSKPVRSDNLMTTNNSKMKKNVRRLGGGGLSLEAFASIKSNRNQYNPALIKKQREFYKNAKYISKYKKSKQHLSQPNNVSLVKPSEDQGEVNESSKRNRKNRKGSQSLRDLYEKKCEEDQKARMVREAIAQAKKEEKEKAEARRKAEREKMLKRTRTGQPVMKYRIEHLLQSIRGSS